MRCWTSRRGRRTGQLFIAPFAGVAFVSWGYRARQGIRTAGRNLQPPDICRFPPPLAGDDRLERGPGRIQFGSRVITGLPSSMPAALLTSSNAARARSDRNWACSPSRRFCRSSARWRRPRRHSLGWRERLIGDILQFVLMDVSMDAPLFSVPVSSALNFCTASAFDVPLATRPTLRCRGRRSG